MVRILDFWAAGIWYLQLLDFENLDREIFPSWGKRPDGNKFEVRWNKPKSAITALALQVHKVRLC